MRLTEGQVAVVTGGASGIGYGLVRAFLDRGLRVVNSDVRGDALRDAADRLGVGNDRLASVVTDVSDAASVAALREETLRRFGRVDVVCNNGGIVVPAAPAWEQPVESWNRLTAVKLMGVVHGVREFVPLLIEQGSGHVVNTASVRGLVPVLDLAPYGAIMHAVVGLTMTLDAELRARGEGLGASVLCPGAVVTDLIKNSAELLHDGRTIPRIVPPGQAMTPDEVAAFTLAAVEEDRVVVMPNEDRLSDVLDHLASVQDQVRRGIGGAASTPGQRR